jgi:hypothetical protein
VLRLVKHQYQVHETHAEKHDGNPVKQVIIPLLEWAIVANRLHNVVEIVIALFLGRHFAVTRALVAVTAASLDVT